MLRNRKCPDYTAHMCMLIWTYIVCKMHKTLFVCCASFANPIALQELLFFLPKSVHIFPISHKKHIVALIKKHWSKAFLMSTHNTFLWRNKKKKNLDFVCVKVLQPSQPIMVMSRAITLPKYIFFSAQT